MLRVGLTGGIGAGKSTVSAMLRQLGAVVIDSDRIAREVLVAGSAGLVSVVHEFGPGVLAEDGRLDRPALARLVFSDAGRRKALEGITHPLIAARTRDLFEAAEADAIVVHDVPLLVEGDLGSAYHLVLVVSAPASVRAARLVDQRAMALDEIRSRMAAQASDRQRRAAADVWIDTDRSRSRVLDEVESLWRRRLVPFENNIRRCIAVRPPERSDVQPYDPDWPVVAARLAARVGGAVGRLGRGVEHIGSTSVPGLAGHPVIDLQLGVAGTADADAVAADLAGAGFPTAAKSSVDIVHPGVDGDPTNWTRRVHYGADPSSPVRLYVRVVDGPGWRTALVLRDWLRNVPEARARHESFERDLIDRSIGPVECTQARRAWTAAAVEGALAWAGR
jgi:dephospho-CoA kinase